LKVESGAVSIQESEDRSQNDQLAAIAEVYLANKFAAIDTKSACADWAGISTGQAGFALIGAIASAGGFGILSLSQIMG
jgi:hypothetical protein